MTATLRYFNICLFLLLSGSITSTMSAWAEDRENDFSFLQKDKIIIACSEDSGGNTCPDKPRSTEEICKIQCNTLKNCEHDICKKNCSNHCLTINHSGDWYRYGEEICQKQCSTSEACEQNFCKEHCSSHCLTIKSSDEKSKNNKK